MKFRPPQVAYDAAASLGIEVLPLAELYAKLTATQDHDPFAPHQVQFYLILLVAKGQCSHTVDFTTYNLDTGASLYIAKHQAHHFHHSLADTQGYAIIFSHLFVDQHYYLTEQLSLHHLFNYHIESPLISPAEAVSDNLPVLGEMLYHEATLPPSEAQPAILAALLRAFLLTAERAKAAHATTHANPQWLDLFSRFTTLLEEQYTESRSSRAYAAQLFISYKHLNDIVKQLSGQTAKSFIDQFVSTEIKRYLVSTSLSVSEISYETGFDEVANMIKFFKKNVGTTPLKFRQEA